MKFKSIYSVALLFIAVLVLNSCNSSSKDKRIAINPEFSTYISAFTSGELSRKNTVKIVLTQSIDTTKYKIGEALPEGVIETSPSMNGIARYIDPFTIEFVAEEWWESGAAYLVEFNLKTLQDVPEEFEKFEFKFHTPFMDFMLNLKGFDKNSTYEKLNLAGDIVFSDVIDTALLGAILKTSVPDAKVNWQSYSEVAYGFTIEEIERKKSEYEIEVNLVGAELGIDKEIKEKYTIPALGDFKIIDVNVDNGIEQCITIYFSDPLSSTSDLSSFIVLDGAVQNKVVVFGNALKVYPKQRLSGERKLKVLQGLKNSREYGMKNEQEFLLSFFAIKPQIELLGKGTILPNAKEGLLFPFRTVNVNNVIVEITKIYTNNIGQFLQVNDISGAYQLNRVSKKVLRKRIDLKSLKDVNLSQWNDFHLDLSEFINVDPGAIYRIELSIDKKGSNYPCKNADAEEDDLTELGDLSADDWKDEGSNDYYDYDYDDYYYDDYYDYDYSQRDNPCHVSYYRNKTVTKNILASDLGITIKAGTDRSYHVFVSDLLSTMPKTGVTVELLDYQQQVVGKGNTDGTGTVKIDPKRKPFLAIVKDGDKRGYLKIRNGLSLSLSKFDIHGQTNENGIKGFLYTERGVRRPGDSIYVGFMIEDLTGKLPAKHPVHFELVNPKGKTIQKKVIIGDKDGIYVWRTKTDASDPTGNWGCRAKVGNATFYKNLKVETVKPNRLKINLDFHQEIITKNKSPKTDLSVMWLHGAIARDLEAKVEMHLERSYGDFEKYKDYIFNDPIYNFSSTDQVVFDGKINNEGVAQFTPKFEVSEFVPGMLKAYFNTRVFEKTGDFSVDKFSVKFSPYESYVGVSVPKGSGWGHVLETGKNHEIGVVIVNEKGEPVNRKGVKVKVYRVENRWWYDNYNRNLANYINRESTELIIDSVMDVTKKGNHFVLRDEYPNWGRYLIRVTDPISGHSSGRMVTIDWPYWRRAERNNQEFATMLNFQSSKKSYDVEEEIAVSFPTSGNEKALITIENGTSVLNSYWVQTTKTQTEFKIKATQEMAPNIYVSISLFQKHGNTNNDLPIRMYGVIPVGIENPASHLNPVIGMAEEVRPESKATISVSEKDGKAMHYTVALVDEGLLDLTRFSTPNPWDHFYAKQALGVKTWDMYDDVIGAFGGQINRILGIGGDGAIEKKGGNKANRFKPMVQFLGDFYLEPNSVAKHEVNIPNYIGSCRVMVVARNEKAYGSAEKYVKVRKPLMVLATLPRVLGPNEELDLPVNVFALKDNVGKVSIKIETNEFLIPTAGKTKSLVFKKSGDEIVSFPLKIADKLGVGKVKVTVSNGKETATHEIEIDVRAPNPEITNVVEMAVEPGKSWSTNIVYPGIKGTNSGSFEASNFPSINLTRRLRYLIRYPHGCIEQTTSAVFPQLHLENVVDLSDYQKRRIATHVTDAINRITRFQTSEGGFAYWPGNLDPNEWGTNYAGHFLLEAKAKGYKIPSYLLNGWIKYQKNMAKRWNQRNYKYPSYSIQAYRLYTLALAGSPDFSAMNQLKALMSSMGKNAQWRLAGAYAMAGQQQVALEIIANLNTHVEDYRELSYSYGSGSRDMAMILEILTEMGEKGRAASLAKDLAERMNSDRWMSTQTTAYSILAISKFLGDSESGKMMQFEYLIGGQSKESLNAKVPFYKVDFDPNKDKKITFKNTGKSILFVKVVQSGIPDQDNRQASNSNVNMSIRYVDLDGRELNPDTIAQGTDFKAVVTISNPGTKGYLREMALNQIFPSGWEIHNNRMDIYNSSEGNYADYKDFRDDRVYTYFSLGTGSRTTFIVKLNAAYKGKFYLPTIETEAMYDNTISSIIPGRWVVVK